MRYLLLTFLLVISTVLTAQSEARGAYANSPVFLQAGLGFLPIIDLPSAELSAAAGYRFTPVFGLGVGFRTFAGGGESLIDSATGLGLHVRLQYPSGVLIGLEGGPVIGSSQGSDNLDSSRYNSGGGYGAVDLGYQFRWGLSLGAYLSVARGMLYDGYLYNSDTNLDEPTGTSFTDGVFGLGFKVGYSFPGRRRR